ncbi:testis-expressed protein 36 [Rhynchocyon petersi]
MPKGQCFKPPLDKDGIWFPHVGITQTTPESITSSTLKEPHKPHSAWQVERKLPPIYKVREQQAVNNSFPFSTHDNRHTFVNSGHYFDSGLGRKKVSTEKRQHVSRNFNLWACDCVPSCLDGCSNNQISYIYKETVVVPYFRRFPRHHSEIWSNLKLIPEWKCTEFSKKKPKVGFEIDKKTTPRPDS